MSVAGVVAMQPTGASHLAAALRDVAADLEDVASRARTRLASVDATSGAPALIEDVAAWAQRLSIEVQGRVEDVVRLDLVVPVARPHLGASPRHLDVRGVDDLDDLFRALVEVGVLGACPLPGDVASRRAALAALGPQTVRRLADQAPRAVGRADGVPFAVRDRANRRLLEREIAGLERRRPQPGSDEARLLADLRRWRDDPDLNVVKLDVSRGRVVLARGDLDDADHVATLVPGAGTSLATLSERHTDWLDRLHDGMRQRLRADGRRGGAATVLWLDYDSPPRLVPDAMGPSAANDAAARLPRYLEGVAAETSPLHTVVGHSYGAVVLGRSLTQAPGTLPADRLIALGGPGLGVQHSGQLALRDDQRLFAGTFAEDPIVHVKRWNPATGVLPRAIHGPDPRRMRDVERIELSTHDLADISPVERHLQYFDADSSALRIVSDIAAGADTHHGQPGWVAAR